MDAIILKGLSVYTGEYQPENPDTPQDSAAMYLVSALWDQVDALEVTDLGERESLSSYYPP